MMRTGLNLGWVSPWGIQLMPMTHKKVAEKNLKYPYQEPTQVPLGEKPKVWRTNPIEGTRQISPVRSQ